MVKKLVIMLAFVLSGNAFSQERQMVTSIFFDTDKAEIRENDKEVLKLVAIQMNKNHNLITIVGHADKRASRLYNLDLAERRVKAVREALLALGANPAQILIQASQGKEKPLAPNDDVAEHLQINRRVDLVFLKPLVKETIIINQKPDHKNRLSLAGGIAPMGIDKDSVSALTTKVTQDYAAAFGLTYARKLNDRFNIGASAYTNNAYYLNIGMDF